MSALGGCSCGLAVEHIVAKRRTADGETVQLWHSGDLTGRFGYPPGVMRAVSAVARAARRHAWAVVELYDWSELAALIIASEGRVRAQQAASAGLRLR